VGSWRVVDEEFGWGDFDEATDQFKPGSRVLSKGASPGGGAEGGAYLWWQAGEEGVHLVDEDVIGHARDELEREDLEQKQDLERVIRN
jgi:hypothetical protein